MYYYDADSNKPETYKAFNNFDNYENRIKVYCLNNIGDDYFYYRLL